MADVIERARKRAGVVARQGDAQRVGRAGRLARGQHALDRRLALGERALERAAPLGDTGRFAAQAHALGLQRGERAVGFRDGAFGVAQRVARLAASALGPLHLRAECFDATTQCLQLLVLCQRGRRRCCHYHEQQRQAANQALTFPCAETAAMRRAASSGSPR